MNVSQLLPWSIWDCLWLAPAALLLDLVLGDPFLPWPHPVCLIGGFLHWAEKAARRLAGSRDQPVRARLEKLFGFLTLAIACICVYAITHILETLPWLGPAFAIYLAWAGLAMGCLLDTGRLVLNRVEHCDLAQARTGVAWLVSRDVSALDRPMLRKTLADTLSENFTDAFLAPFFWLVFTGPAGLWLYKAVSTMDSQWGYLTPPWRDLGCAGAKADDLLAWLPARLSPWALLLANAIVRPFRRGRKIFWQGAWPGIGRIAKDAAGMTSPNSGWPMAACAWLCWGRMAGPSVYFGQLVHKGYIGPASAAPWNETSLRSLLLLLFWGSICGGAMLWLLGALARAAA